MHTLSGTLPVRELSNTIFAEKQCIPGFQNLNELLYANFTLHFTNTNKKATCDQRQVTDAEFTPAKLMGLS
jgi:hypothetical protein